MKSCFSICVLAAVMAACSNIGREISTLKLNKINYTIILDLSDRVVDEGQIHRDTTLIRTLVKEFEDDLEDGTLKIKIARQKDSNLSEALRKEYEEKLILSTDHSLEMILQKDVFFQTLKRLYSDAKFSQDRNDYKGADIVQALGEDLRLEMVDTTKMTLTNNIFVITDGYQYIKGNQAGLVGWPVFKKDLGGAKVMVLEISPVETKDRREFDRIQKAWHIWLVNSRINCLVIEKNISLDDVHESIRRLLSTNLISPVDSTKYADVNLKDSPGQYTTISKNIITEIKPEIIAKVTTRPQFQSQQELEIYLTKMVNSLLIKPDPKKVKILEECASQYCVVNIGDVKNMWFSKFIKSLSRGELKSKRVYDIGITANDKINLIELR